MLLGSNSNLRAEDYPSEHSWISGLLFPLNQFLSSVTSAFNGNITFGDNIPCQTIALKFMYGGSSDFPKSVKFTVPNVSPVELRVCSATENSSAIAVIVAWSYASGQISLSSIYKITSAGVAALTVGYQYNIVMRAQP